jgi:hypothetical protein
VNIAQWANIPLLMLTEILLVQIALLDNIVIHKVLTSVVSAPVVHTRTMSVKLPAFGVKKGHIPLAILTPEILHVRIVARARL